MHRRAACSLPLYRHRHPPSFHPRIFLATITIIILWTLSSTTTIRFAASRQARQPGVAAALVTPRWISRRQQKARLAAPSKGPRKESQPIFPPPIFVQGIHRASTTLNMAAHGTAVGSNDGDFASNNPNDNELFPDGTFSTVDTLQECLRLTGSFASVTDPQDGVKILEDACQLLEHVKSESNVPPKSLMTASLTSDDHSLLYGKLCQLAWQTAQRMCQIDSDPSRKRKQKWCDLQSFSQRLLVPYPNAISGDSDAPDDVLLIPGPANALAISMVFGVLAWNPPVGDNDNNDVLSAGGAKASASALATTVARALTPGKKGNDHLEERGHSAVGVASSLLRAYLSHAITTSPTTTTRNSLLGTWNWNTMTQFTRAFALSERDHPDLASLVAQVTLQELQRVRDMDDDDPNATCTLEARKQIVSGLLSLVCQVRPWSATTATDDKTAATTSSESRAAAVATTLVDLSPLDLVQAAIPLDYWHGAELVCQSTHEALLVLRPSSPQQHQMAPVEVKKAVEYLIDMAMDVRTYRRADNLATNLYDLGGRSRFVQARFQHACDTIAQVVFKRQYPIIERQVNRVDKAVERQAQQQQNNGSDNQEDDVAGVEDWDFDASQEIRIFALRKLDEAGQHDAAHRLAKLWKLDYVYDEEAMLAAAEARRQTYLQFDEAFVGQKQQAIPDLISTADHLRAVFEQFWSKEKEGSPYANGPFGLDAEWEEDTKGVDVLQFSHPKSAILIDIPALVATPEGVAALKDTVGKLLDSSQAVVVGFACRQDLARLAASSQQQQQGGAAGGPSTSWLTGTQAVIDIQPLIVKREPKLASVSSSVGLARVCQHYFGKPLDKSEQCSFWGARPLSEGQRSYAALDAWVCAAVYEKLFPGTSIRTDAR